MPRYLQLNNYTQYKVVLYGLIAVALYSIFLSLFGAFSFNVVPLVASLFVIVFFSYTINRIFSWGMRIPTNSESYLITALILFLILEPADNLGDFGILIVAVGLAISSKFLVKMHKRHIFNPAAFAGLTLTLLQIPVASWWVANPEMMPVVALVGFLIVKKIRRFLMFGAFFVFAIAAIFYFGIEFSESALALLRDIIISWPIIFFGTVMFTEPRTTPPTRKLQLFYGALVGILFGSSFSIGQVHSTPEFALVAGNLFSWAVSPKSGHLLKLQRKEEIGAGLYNFVFEALGRARFIPGQYMEWTLGHKQTDSRGNRRYFSIASSPTEVTLQLGVKILDNSSSFKRALLTMKKGDAIMATHVAGDFVLPKDEKVSVVLIAGGIGITPIRSMIKYLADSGQKRKVVVFYAASSAREFIYKEDLDEAAKQIGAKINYLITKKENAPKNWRGKVGYLNAEMIKEIPNYKNYKYYLSGPNSMVDSYKKLLHSLGIPRWSIITDYFPGY